MSTIQADGVSKSFPRSSKSDALLTVLHPTSLAVESGQLVVVSGRSGSGKSTLVNIMAGMLEPTSGTVSVDDVDMYSLSEERRAILRNEKVGYVPQGHAALQSLTVLENALLPAAIHGDADAYEERARDLLARVGLDELVDSKPNELSGGELRRLALVRALVMEPGVILVDEPTAGLDADNVRVALELLREAADNGAAVLAVSHEHSAEAYADMVLNMESGKLEA